MKMKRKKNNLKNIIQKSNWSTEDDINGYKIYQDNEKVLKEMEEQE